MARQDKHQQQPSQMGTPKHKSSNRGRQNGRKYTNKSKKQYDEAEESKTNDPSWYGYNEQAIRDAANISFATPAGLGHSLTNRLDLVEGSYPYVTFPGITIFNAMPSFGYAFDHSAPINMTANRLYSYMRTQISGSRTYEPADLMMIIGAMDSYYAMFANIRRAYGIANLYSPLNRHLPRNLLTALGFNPDTFIDNMANIRSRLNNIAVKSQAITIPEGMSYFTKHIWMYSNVWMDDPDPKANLMAYVPSAYYIYEAYADKTGGKLRYADIPTAAQEWDYYLDMLDSTIDALLSDYDVGTICGDFWKAFQSKGLVTLPLLEEFYTVAPQYDPVTSEIMHNTKIIGKPVHRPSSIFPEFTDTRDIYQAGGFVYSNLSFESYIGEAALLNSIIDVPTPTPDAKLVIDVTRNMAIPHKIERQDPDDPQSPYYIDYGTLGSEFITSVTFYSTKSTPQGGYVLTHKEISSSNTADVTNYDVIKGLMAMARPPMLYAFVGNRFADVLATVSNPSVLTYTDLKRMNDLALLSMFEIPSIKTT